MIPATSIGGPGQALVHGSKPLRCVYLTYDGLLDPLGQSQVLPYIRCLVAVGHSFMIISYEKARENGEIEKLEHQLRGMGVEWRRLPFRCGKLEFAKRVIAGVRLLRNTCRQLQPDLMHLRGLMPAVIYQLAGLNVPHLYDFRGFALEEWTSFGKIRVGSIPYRILRRIDRRAVATACGLVVLEKPAEVLLRQTYPVPDVPLKVIRTCTDVQAFGPRRPASGVSPDTIRFICLGGARAPYRPDLALRMVRQLLNAGGKCRVDFFNERDHALITAAIAATGFPRNLVELVKIEHRDVPGRLADYDCGLVFLDSSPWRRVCSPTKVGEYLAAGLPVISLNGVDVLEHLAATTPCVKIVREEDISGSPPKKWVEEVVAFIRASATPAACRELAAREFSMELAGRLYVELYAEIEAARQ